MYPLYRSWLGSGPGHDPAALQTPPDTIIIVGDSTSASRQFAGHRVVLTAHSGFFKGALAGRSTSPTSICVPSVFPEAFGPLLSFMYTGYLDISPDNIYAVLLATHYLHMPRALDLCWAYLRQNQLLPTSVPTAPLVKPIPSRGKLPALAWHQPSSLNTILLTAEHSPFRTVYGQAAPPKHLADDAIDHAPDETIDVGGTPPVQTPSPVYVPGPRSPEPTARASPRSPTRSPPKTEVAVVGNSSLSPRRSPHRETNTQYPETSEATSHQDQMKSSTTAQSIPKTSLEQAQRSSPSSKVVIDVACCDGPVRFHRVLNQSYGLADGAAMETEEVVSDDAVDENQVATRRVRLPGAGQLRRARAERLAAAAASATASVDGGESTSPKTRPHNSSDGQIDYTCLYCNHTFKSHYCYQKHASRHLNPVSPKGVIGHVKGSAINPSVQPATSRPGREAVRPLDMNVQYYPCKTCGSKFPSYYFVHKHRKMCHLSESSQSPGAAQPSSSEGSAKPPEENKSSS